MKEFKRNFHQIGLPQARRWSTLNFIVRACRVLISTNVPSGRSWFSSFGEVHWTDRRRRRTRPASYLCQILEVHSCVEDFYVQSLPQVVTGNCLVGKSTQTSAQRSYVYIQPIRFFRDPEKVRGLVFRADFQGAGAQFHRKLQAGELSHLVQQQFQSLLERLQRKFGLRNKRHQQAHQRIHCKGEGAAFLWLRPTLSGPRGPQQPTEATWSSSCSGRSARIEQSARSRKEPAVSRGRTIEIERRQLEALPHQGTTPRTTPTPKGRDNPDPKDNRLRWKKSSEWRCTYRFSLCSIKTPTRQALLEDAPWRREPEPARDIEVEQPVEEGAASGAPDLREEVPTREPQHLDTPTVPWKSLLRMASC